MPPPTAEFGSLLLACYDRVKKDVGAELSKWRNVRQVSKLYRHIASFRQVKTIWSADRAIDLRTFYHPTSIHLDSRRKTIATIDDLPDTKNIVIQGIAGQGKSIFIRHLCSSELERSKRIPIFIELRKITKEVSLMAHIAKCFTDFDLDYDEEAFCFLYGRGKLCLLLDGFDEVDDACKASLIWDLESLSRRFPLLKIIVTARPESDICNSASFEVVRLAELRGSDYAQVIRNLLPNNDPLGDELLRAIKQHKNNIARLLTTPLLVTLLTITYKAHEKLPDQLSEFYDSVFTTLIWQHDKLKPGFRRPRKSGITSDSDFRRIFEALSFYIKRVSKTSYDEEVIQECATKAIAIAKMDTKPDLFLADVVAITCLIVRDSTEYRFIHRSIQEFFAACYIAKRPEKSSIALYDYLYSRAHYYRFYGELNFLQSIDRFRYIQFYAIPSACRIYEARTDHEVVALTADQRAQRFLELTKATICCFIGSPEHDSIGWSGLTLEEPRSLGHFYSIQYSYYQNRLFPHIFGSNSIDELAGAAIAASGSTHKARVPILDLVQWIKKENSDFDFDSLVLDIERETFHHFLQLREELISAESEPIDSVFTDLG